MSIALACTRSVPVQVISGVPPAPPPPVAATAAVWAYRPPATRQAYFVEQTAQVAVRTDTSVRVDSVSSRAEVTFSIASPTGRVAGSILAFSVRNGAGPAMAPPGVSLPVQFSADYSVPGRQLMFTTPFERAPCGSVPLSVAQGVRDLWFRPPDSLRIGTVWVDTATYVVCRDGVPLEMSSHRTFRVMSRALRGGRQELLISRSARTAVRGEGVRGTDTSRVSGTGAGELTYAFDVAEGRIVDARGEATLELLLRARTRSLSVRQVSVVSISAAPVR